MVKKFSDKYTNKNGSVEYMYYIKIIENFQKTAPDPLYRLHLSVNIPQAGNNDLNTYPSNWTKTGLSLMAFTEKHHRLIFKKTYDFHTAFDIHPHKWFTMCP